MEKRLAKLYIRVLLLVCVCQIISGLCPEDCQCDPTVFQVTCTVLDQASLQRISKVIDNNTKELDLSGNSLTRFDAPFKLDSLTVLDLSKNALKSIPTGLNVMFPNLEVLKINENGISKLEASDFNEMGNLTKLTLDNNTLTTLSNGIFQNLVNLKQLVIKSNRISTISKDAFQGLSKLVNLDLSFNEISELKPGLFDYFSATALAITLPQNNLKALQNGLFSKLKEFKMLELSSNQISTVGDRVFDNVAITEFINLYDNKLESLPFDTLLNSSIKVLSIAQNPINCSCGMRKLFPKFKNKLFGTCNDGNAKVDFNTELSLKNEDGIAKALCTQCDLNNTCLNGGHCKPIGKTDLECKCIGQYYGSTCQNVPVCSMGPCKHGGTCVPVNGTSYRCLCKDDYGGRDCGHVDGEGGLSEACIAGIVLGIVFLIVVIVIILIFTRRRCEKRKDQDPKNPNELSSLKSTE